MAEYFDELVDFGFDLLVAYWKESSVVEVHMNIEVNVSAWG